VPGAKENREKKMAPHEILRSEKHVKGGTTDQAQEFELCVALTLQKYDGLMLGALTTHNRLRYVRCLVLREHWTQNCILGCRQVVDGT